MARTPNANDSSRLYLRPSSEVEAYLEELARIGIHGKTKSEVAKTLVGNAVVELINSGFLEKRRARRRKPSSVRIKR